jgi:hypothetical protein
MKEQLLLLLVSYCLLHEWLDASMSIIFLEIAFKIAGLKD